MKGPGIKDYLAAIEKKKQEAIAANQQTLDITSKWLHQEISPNHATMPTCCQAMYKLALEGDEILRRPKGTTGYGSHLVIRYSLTDLNRNSMFPNKKRGRPSKTPEEKLAAKKAKMKRNSEELMLVVKAWLVEHNYEVSENKNEIVATLNDTKRIVNIQGIKRGRKQTLPSKLSEMMTKMEEETYYSIAFNDSSLTRRQWNEISEVVKKQLKLSVLLADKQGNISEL